MNLLSDDRGSVNAKSSNTHFTSSHAVEEGLYNLSASLSLSNSFCKTNSERMFSFIQRRHWYAASKLFKNAILIIFFLKNILLVPVTVQMGFEVFVAFELDLMCDQRDQHVCLVLHCTEHDSWTGPETFCRIGTNFARVTVQLIPQNTFMLSLRLLLSNLIC